MTGSQWRSSLHRADAIAAAVIACQAAVLAFISLSGSWFQDDLRAMSQAAAYGWSSDWLFGAGVGGTHFSPLTRAWFTLLDVIAPMNRPVAVATVVVMQAATSALLWWLCRRLGVRSGPALLVLAVYALSPLTLTSLAWTIQAVQFVPVHLGLLIAAHGQLSYIRTRQPRWILLSLAGVCVGLLAWEKTLAGLGLLVLLAPLWTGTVRQSRLRPVLNLWPLVLSYGALAVLYLAGWRIGGYGTGQAAAGGATVVEAVATAWWASLGPGLLAGPWQWDQLGKANFLPFAGTSTVIGVASLLIIVVAVLWFAPRIGWRRTAWATVAFILVSTVSVGMASLGRSTAYGLLIARDPRYSQDVVLYAALTAATLLAFLPAARAVGRAGARARLAFVACGCAVLCILTTWSYSEFVRIWSRNPVGQFLAAAEDSVPLTETSALDSRVPPDVMSGGLFGSFAYASSVLRPVRPHLAFGRLGAGQGIVDERGGFVAADYKPISFAERGSQPECRTQLSARTRTVADFVLKSPVVHLEGLTLRIDTLSGKPVPWTVEVSRDGIWRSAAPDLPASPDEPMPWDNVPVGLVASTFLLPRAGVDAVRISVSPPAGEVVCVLDVSVGIAAAQP